MPKNTQWTEGQQAHMNILEKVKKPTEMQKGELRSLSMTARTDAEQIRAQALNNRWTAKAKAKAAKAETDAIMGMIRDE